MLEARNLSFSYEGKASAGLLIDDCSLRVEPGERVALQAPSGFGKTTLCRLLAGYLVPLKGEVLVDGAPLAAKGMSPVQMIMQHPEAAVDPRMRMQETLAEAGPLNHELIERFGIKPEWLQRFPHELSGGELQRFCIVRALSAQPRYIIADEISTMLDAITQARIWHGLLEEAAAKNLGMIVVTHSPSLANRIATRTIVLKQDFTS